MNRPPNAVLACCLGVGLIAASEGLPLGHEDFQPSPEHPIGLLGDGSGLFPGATPPKQWDYRTGANIRWMAPLPVGDHGSPIVVGDRVYIQDMPDRLFCFDADTGTELWQHQVSSLTALPVAKRRFIQETYDELMAFRGDISAVMYEWARLRYQLARYDAVQAGTELAIDRQLFSHSLQVSAKAARSNHLTRAEEQALDTAVASWDAALVQSKRDRLEELHRLIAERRYHAGNGYVTSHMPFARGEGESAFRQTPAGQRWAKSWALVNHYGLVPSANQPWYGPAFMTPASDGDAVYVTFGTGQTAGFTLDGNLLWQRQPRLWECSLRGDQAFDDRHLASPVLTDDAVVVMHGHYANKANGSRYRWLDIRAFDKQTGELRWYHRADNPGGHRVPLLRRFRHGGLDLILTTAGPVLDAVTGRSYTDVGFATCAQPTVFGDHVLWQQAGPGGGGPRRAALFRFGGDLDKPDIQTLWRSANSERDGIELRSTTAILWHQGRLVSERGLVDPQSGHLLDTFKLDRQGAIDANLVIAGDILLSLSLGGQSCLVDLASTPPRTVGGGLIGSHRMRRFLLHHDDLDTVRTELRRGGLLMNADRLCTANPWPQGQRLYLRSIDTLYCIEDRGDPVDLRDYRR